MGENYFVLFHDLIFYLLGKNARLFEKLIQASGFRCNPQPLEQEQEYRFVKKKKKMKNEIKLFL